jgi:hypothetical protein
MLIARGVFKEDTITRRMTTPGGGGGGRAAGGGGANRAVAPLDENGKREIREALNTYLKPYLKG